MNKLFEMVGGSHAYGLNTPASDVDNRGVFLNDKLGYVLGLRKHEDQQYTEGGADDKFKEFRRFLNLLRESNTEALEMLYSKSYTFTSAVFNVVRKNRERFLDSKRLYTCLRGYMQGELRRANGELKGKMGKRKEMLDRFGFSPKNFTQLFRLAWAGCTFFEKGYFPVNVKEENPDFAFQLLTLKMNPDSFERAKLNDLATHWETKLDEAYNNRKKDFTFDEDFANDLVLMAYFPTLQKFYDKHCQDWAYTH